MVGVDGRQGDILHYIYTIIFIMHYLYGVENFIELRWLDLLHYPQRGGVENGRADSLSSFNF